jgi:Sec-independent protein translocase protein TatA
LEKALAQAKKQNAALLKRQKLTIQYNKVLDAERKVLSCAVGDKRLTILAKLIGCVIESARREMASKQEQNEKEFKRLQRNATHRDEVVGKLQERLQNTISELGKLRDFKNKALREV